MKFAHEYTNDLRLVRRVPLYHCVVLYTVVYNHGHFVTGAEEKVS